MFSWYAADSYLAIIIWSTALKRFELICYYLIPFHDFPSLIIFYVYGKNNWRHCSLVTPFVDVYWF